MFSKPSLQTIKPTDLPAPPQSALEILRACSHDDIDNSRLAEFAQTDPVLVAEILRVVNSPLYGIAQEVASVKPAINLLGVRALRNIVLCLMVRELAQTQVSQGIDLTLFWEDTLRRAVTARWLGSQSGLDQDECFTAGLLQDFGLLILFHLNPALSSEYLRLRAEDPQQRYQSELQLFGTGHDEVLSLLIAQWSLPQTMVQAIANHHQTAEKRDKLADVLHSADWVNAIFCVAEVEVYLARVRDMLVDAHGINAAEVVRQLNAIPQQVNETAACLGLHIQNQQDFDTVMREANRRLAQENSDYQELTWKLEKTLAERDALAAELNREIAIAREVQRHLMPDQQARELPLCGLNIPARNISGDFYDYQQLPDGTICFALGDVSGKGINAGLLMAKTASLFHCLSKHTRDPSQLLTIINNELCETSAFGLFVTMLAGIYQPQTHEVWLASAGHLPALLIGSDNSVKLIDGGEQPLGILPQTRFSLSGPIDLNGGVLYLYSDGVTEAKTPNGAMLEREGLVKLIRQYRNLSPPDHLQAIADAIMPESALHDDMTLLMISGE